MNIILEFGEYCRWSFRKCGLFWSRIVDVGPHTDGWQLMRSDSSDNC